LITFIADGDEIQLVVSGATEGGLCHDRAAGRIRHGDQLTVKRGDGGYASR
jgi:hypothetical protein